MSGAAAIDAALAAALEGRRGAAAGSQAADGGEMEGHEEGGEAPGADWGGIDNDDDGWALPDQPGILTVRGLDAFEHCQRSSSVY